MLELLHVHQVLVGAVACQQVGVRALLDDASVLHHANHIGIFDRAQPVGNHQCGASLHQVVEGFLHQMLAFGVERQPRSPMLVSKPSSVAMMKS